MRSCVLCRSTVKVEVKDTTDNQRVQGAVLRLCKLLFIFISWFCKQMVVTILKLIFQAFKYK